MVETINISRACEACITKGSDAIRTCTHVKTNKLKMRSHEKEQLFIDYLVDTGNSSTACREILGVEKRDDSLLFEYDTIDWMFRPETYYQWIIDVNHPTYHFKNIIIAVDPNAGGSNPAAICICGFITATNKYVILYMDTTLTKNYSEYRRLVFGSIIKFNEMYPTLYTLDKLMFIETNGAFNGGSLVDSYEGLTKVMYKKIGPIKFAGNDRRYGVYKTAKNTLQYMKTCQRALLLNNIKLSDAFANLASSKTVIDILRKQMETFPRIRSTEYMSKKLKGDIQDDLLITLFMCLYWHGESLVDKKLFQKTNEI